MSFFGIKSLRHNRMERTMVGGAKFQQAVLEWSKQSMNLFNTIFMILIAVYALYADKVPANIRWQLSTTLGRLLLVLVLYIVFALAGWLPALLFTIAVAITWANRPLWKPVTEEGFRGGGDFTTAATATASQMSFGSEAMVGSEKEKKDVKEGFLDNMKETKTTKNRWFVEQVLKENPKKIIEDRVRTAAVQE